jgi:hypothetical protein
MMRTCTEARPHQSDVLTGLNADFNSIRRFGRRGWDPLRFDVVKQTVMRKSPETFEVRYGTETYFDPPALRCKGHDRR